MSDLADRVRHGRQLWAAPGGSHDKLIRVMNWILPVIIGVLIAFLAIAPIMSQNEISFVLAKDKVEVAKERMRISRATYTGEDSKGQPFSIKAGSAVQVTSQIPVVNLHDLLAEIILPDGPAQIRANDARYDMHRETVAVDGPVVFTTSDGYRLETSNVGVDMKSRSVSSDNPVQGKMPLGSFSADSIKADLPSRTVILDGRAKLRIVQGNR